ncbi:fungal hydrophobin [Tricholoma matsutake]|nr:fungal hydrophobin [Tricholoma matsutake 945]
MKFFSVFAILATAILGVCATPEGETNASRFARGLPPLPPRRRSTHVAAAKRSAPSGSWGGSCNTGSIQCCNSVQRANKSKPSSILQGLGIFADPTAMVGMHCSPLSAIGLGGNQCTQQPVCCDGNSYSGGLIVLDCSPVNI